MSSTELKKLVQRLPSGRRSEKAVEIVSDAWRNFASLVIGLLTDVGANTGVTPSPAVTAITPLRPQTAAEVAATLQAV